ncbi:hypothetical protein JCM8547_002106 [Rhodosporidiobolus lusitaniae]
MPLLVISPRKLFRTSFLAGSIFAVAALVLCIDLIVLGLRGYAYNLTARWRGLDEVVGLDAIGFSLLVSELWYCTLVFLLVDLCFTLLLPSRDLQDGAVISFGIVSFMQIPLVTLFLEYELSWSNQVWVINACNIADFADSCSGWWNQAKVAAISTSAIGVFLHLLLFVMCAYYVHYRPATSQNLIMNHRRMKSKKKKASRPKPPVAPYSSEDSDGGAPLQRTATNRTSATLPPAYSMPPYSGGTGDVHTDSELSDLEKQQQQRLKA